MKTTQEKVLAPSPEVFVSKFTGEFLDKKMEQRFLSTTWEDYKISPRNAMYIGGMIFLAFSITDLLSEIDQKRILHLFLVRGLTSLFLFASAGYIHREKSYFAGFHLLSLTNQLVIAFALIMIGMLKNLLFIHNAFHVFMLTLVFYQFVHNRFSYTLMACSIFPLMYIGINLGYYDLNTIDIVRFILYLALANGLGIQMLRSLNRNRRKEYLQHLKVKQANLALKSTVEKLLMAQQEIKTLKGILPICCVCKKIRDDKGYWNQLESYIRKHSDAEFSHGICQECAKKMYPDFDLNKD
ncbi:MAG: hypothetical protein PVH87_18490 [Desulfobacteraceae bacterium]|jgi:hypothetical protein